MNLYKEMTPMTRIVVIGLILLLFATVCGVVFGLKAALVGGEIITGTTWKTGVYILLAAGFLLGVPKDLSEKGLFAASRSALFASVWIVMIFSEALAAVLAGIFLLTLGLYYGDKLCKRKKRKD